MKYQNVPDKTGFLYSLKFKLIILVWYCVQNTGHVLFMSYTTTRNVSENYYTTVAVFLTEIVKVAMCLIFVLADANFNPLTMLKMIRDQMLLKPKDTLKVCIPTILYMIQNNVLYTGAAHLSATAFMITLQLKLMSAAIFSVILLKRKLNVLHWFALFILFAGVAIVQLNGAKNHKHHTTAVGAQIPLLGFAATVFGCVTSGFAGVFLEKIYKKSTGTPVSIWMRNVQMSVFSIPSSFAMILLKDGAKVYDTRLLYGFDWIVWTQVLWLSIGGLTVGVCIKYSNVIVKDMATSMAIVLATIGSIYLFHFVPNWLFGIGAALVISSIFLYSYSNKIMDALQVGTNLTAVMGSSKGPEDFSAAEKGQAKGAKKAFKIFQLKKCKPGTKDTVVPIEDDGAQPPLQIFVLNHSEFDYKKVVDEKSDKTSESSFSSDDKTVSTGSSTADLSSTAGSESQLEGAPQMVKNDSVSTVSTSVEALGERPIDCEIPQNIDETPNVKEK